MRKLLLNFINPIELVNAYRYHKKSSKYDKSAYDLELFLYSKILKNDMLHYGYFEDTNIEVDTISLKTIEEAQINYSQKIIEQISNTDDLILDVGCGMGGLANLLHKKGLKVEALTPDENQIKHVKLNYPNIPCFITQSLKNIIPMLLMEQSSIPNRCSTFLCKMPLIMQGNCLNLTEPGLFAIISG
jgi:SAM-dependent methyltransferase